MTKLGTPAYSHPRHGRTKFARIRSKPLSPEVVSERRIYPCRLEGVWAAPTDEVVQARPEKSPDNAGRSPVRIGTDRLVRAPANDFVVETVGLTSLLVRLGLHRVKEYTLLVFGLSRGVSWTRPAVLRNGWMADSRNAMGAVSARTPFSLAHPFCFLSSVVSSKHTGKGAHYLPAYQGHSASSRP